MRRRNNCFNNNMRNYMMNNRNVIGNSMINNRGYVILKEGSKGSDVEELQTMLFDLAKVYPELLIITVDGVFGPNTKSAVMDFQKVSGLIINGIVDANTWNKLHMLYKKNYNSIDSNKCDRIPDYLDQSNNVLSKGSSGEYVVELQKYLNALSSKYPTITKVEIDGIFGPKTQSAVLEFQKLMGLTIDGIVGMTTWDKLYNEYTNIMGQ